MNVELQIMFHILLFTLCFVIVQNWKLNLDLIEHAKKKLNDGNEPHYGFQVLLTLFSLFP